jgi:hypothetical protein
LVKHPNPGKNAAPAANFGAFRSMGDPPAPALPMSARHTAGFPPEAFLWFDGWIGEAQSV